MEGHHPTLPFPDLTPDPEVTEDSVRFVQTAGGRTNLPAPRTVARRRFMAIQPPLAWTTLALTIKADGTSEFELPGASSFPRHWIYDDSGKLVAKSGLVDFKTWYRTVFDETSPWGSGDSPAVVTEAETELERELSRRVMKSKAALKRRSLQPDETLVNQGDKGRDLFLVLDGVLAVEVDGSPVAEVGPGALLGERALLESGVRTSTLRATTRCRVAVLEAGQIDLEELRQVSAGHRREDPAP